MRTITIFLRQTSAAMVITSNVTRLRPCRLHSGLVRLLPATQGGQSPSPSKRNYSSLLGTAQSKNVVLQNNKYGRDCGVRPSRSLSLESAQQSFHLFYFGCLKSTPVTLMMEQLCAIHDSTGLPWWATIAATTFTLRGLLLFPACVTSQKVSTD